MQNKDQVKKDDKGSCSSSMPKTGSCGTEAKKADDKMGSCSSTSGSKDKGKGGSCS